MARLFLINPPTDETVRSPLLSFLYLAAALRRGSHEVALLDCSAEFAPKEHPDIVARALAFDPDLVGIHCKTLYAQDAYALAKSFGKAVPLVCGGPHPTVAPLEPLDHGFDFSVRGEGEETLTELCDALDGKRKLEDVRSLAYEGGLNPSRGFLLDLDALASPIDALDLFDPRWYGASKTVPPAGLLSSRGCPAACTFCSNNVTGRRFRYRSPAAIASEISTLRKHTDFIAFSFFDDSFAVGRRRMNELCDALVGLGVQWTCTAHPAHLDPDILKQMKRAGCRGVDIGMESGDPSMLLRIGKGVTVERVLDVLGWAQDLGLHCMLNLMFGWPDETLDELEATVDFIDRAAPLAAAFNARGVLVPYPGTRIYDENHARFGFTEWWLREPPLRYRPFPASWDREEVKRAYADDAALARNYFRLSDAHLGLIEEGLQRKADATYRKIAAPAAPGWEPRKPAIAAAGAR
ncbi:MAG: radical SAM protein [Myxococcales bacterium]|nr:B12-binding domain-containing radical SAM protein [Myxococcales bacterium]